MKKLKVAVVSGGRSDYGPLKNILRKLAASESIELNLILTGTHLDPDHGSTVDEVIEDGFVVHKRIDILSEASGPEVNAHSMANALKEFSSYFLISKPDLLLGLGDRYELFAVVTAAVSMGVPVGHIGGGDITDGALDEFWRHGITKLSTFHFPALEQHAERIVSMGESRHKICVIG